MKSSRHSGNSVHCPRSASSTKRLIDPPTESRGNHNSGTAFSHSQDPKRTLASADTIRAAGAKEGLAMVDHHHWQLDGIAPELYEKYLVPAITTKWADDLVGRSQPTAGEEVLDVACGTG